MAAFNSLTSMHDADINTVTSSRDSNGTLVIAVEGNIGAGKSTFLDYCAWKPDIAIFPKSFSRWQNVQGVNLLHNFYTDPARWAMPFQLYAGLTFLENYTTATWHGIKFVERSLLSARHVFLHHMKRMGTIDPTMATILEHWYDSALTVYLRTTPAVAYERLRSRARPAEATVPQQYLREIHDLHEQWIAGVQVRNMLYDEPTLSVFVIDADLPLPDLYSAYDDCLDNVRTLTHI